MITKRILRNPDWTIWAGLGIWFAVVMAHVVVICGIIYVAIHFIAKWW